MIAPSRTSTQPTGGLGRHAGNAKPPCAMASHMNLANGWGTSVIPVRLLRLRCEAQSCLLGDLVTDATHCVTALGVFPLARHAHDPPILIFQDLLYSPLEKQILEDQDWRIVRVPRKRKIGRAHV